MKPVVMNFLKVMYSLIDFSLRGIEHLLYKCLRKITTGFSAICRVLEPIFRFQTCLGRLAIEDQSRVALPENMAYVEESKL
jgi:hypothetical protein